MSILDMSGKVQTQPRGQLLSLSPLALKGVAVAYETTNSLDSDRAQLQVTVSLILFLGPICRGAASAASRYFPGDSESAGVCGWARCLSSPTFTTTTLFSSFQHSFFLLGSFSDLKWYVSLFLFQDIVDMSDRAQPSIPPTRLRL